MMTKLMKYMKKKNIKKIGHRLLIFVFLFLFFTSCGWFCDPETRIYSYAYVVNNSTDTVVFTRRGFFYSSSLANDQKICPNDTFELISGGLDEGEDGDYIDAAFSEMSGFDSTYVICYDSLRDYINSQTSFDKENPYYPSRASILQVYGAPLREMGDGINNFYNRSSWIVIKRETTSSSNFDDEADIYFTIYESDLEY
jgi:hypothetical protein